MRRILYATILMLCCSCLVSAQSEARLLRFPAIHGDQVVFSYAGDLYTVTSEGGTARKLTSDIGYEMFPKFSPDGKQIAFTAQYDGNTEVYLMPAEGGVPKRLTITATLGRDDISDRMGPNNIVMTWTRDGKNVIYRSRKQTFNDFVGQLFSVPVEGGLSKEIPLPAGGFCSYSPDGKKLAYNRVFREFRTWKYYKGGMADDIWIYDQAAKKVQNITDNKAQDIFPMWFGEDIYFLSDRDRTMNLFAYNTVSGATRKVTSYTEYDIKFPSAGDKSIIYENGGYLYVFDIATQKIQKLSITISDDMMGGRSEFKDATKFMGSVSPSPDGNRVVVSARGDVFSIPAKDGVTRNLTQSSAAHDRAAVWSPDGRYIAYLSDMNGEYEIYMQKQDGTEPPVQLTKGADTYKFGIQWSPDSKKILWNDKMLRLQFVDIDTKAVTLVDVSTIRVYRSFNWSPDSKWIAYGNTLSNNMQQIMLYCLADKSKTEITDKWFDSDEPAFSADGKYLVFTSDREFNPIYSQVEWNYAYTNMSNIFLVTLSKETASPFAPENDEVKISSAPAKEGAAADKPKSKDKKDPAAKTDAAKETPAPLKIDLEGIQDRIVELPLKASNYGNLYAIDDKIYYNESASGGDGRNAKVYDLKNKKEIDLGSGISFDITANNKKMLVHQGDKYAMIDLPSVKINIDKFIDMSDAKVWVSFKDEWKQIYDESWRQMRDFFYMPNMHGLNWTAMHDKYAVLLPYVNNRNDLNYLIGEMIAELSIGHAYIGGGDRPMPERISVGLLGARLSKDASGYFRIDKILKGANWSPELRSPLSEIGVGASEGDFILSVDGKSTRDMIDIYAALINKAGKEVQMILGKTTDEKTGRKVLVVPLKTEAALYYYNYVQNNIRKVDEATKGEVGYIHVPDMGPEGLNEFVKHFYPQLSKKALIIDDRGNGGGNVSPMLIERLQREITRSNMSRNVSQIGHTPQQMILGPKVLLINNYSASDGDLFPYAFKKHKLGTVIGMRTWGGVVGISGSLPFVDGTDLRKPEHASYSAEESKWIIEGTGVEPDITIDNDPILEYEGTDQQLNKAIEVVLEQLKDYKEQPPIPEAPDKSK